MRDGSLDFAVAHVSPQTLDAEFEGIELFPVRLTIGMRKGHPMRHCRSLRELHAAEWVLPGDSELGRESVAPLFSPMGLTPPARVIFGESVTVALGLVVQMDLVGLFVEPLVDVAFKRYGIRRIEVEETLPLLSMCVIKRREQRLAPAAQQFVECIQRAAAQRHAQTCGVG